MPQATDLSKTPKNWNKMSNAEKYKFRVAVSYGKDARPKWYNKGLAVAQVSDAKGAKKAPPKKTPRKRVASKSSVW